MESFDLFILHSPKVQATNEILYFSLFNSISKLRPPQKNGPWWEARGHHDNGPLAVQGKSCSTALYLQCLTKSLLREQQSC